MQNQLWEFVDHLKSAGVEIKNYNDIPVNDTGQRKLVVDSKGKKTIYIGFDSSRNIGSWYNCRTGESGYWCGKNNYDKASKDEIEKAKKEYALKIKEAKEQQESFYKKRQIELTQYYVKAALCYDHEYLAKKGVKPTNIIKQDKDKILIPLVDINGALWNIQTIDNQGEKLYQYGAKKKGMFFPVGWKPSEGIPDKLVVCEGVATGLSIYEATNRLVACAMDVHNIKPVIVSLKDKNPNIEIIIAPDNDQWRFKTPRDKSVNDIDPNTIKGDDPLWAEWRNKGFLYNIGLEKAKDVALKHDCYVCIPDFKCDDPDKLKDFNDLYVKYGAERLCKLFESIGKTNNAIDIIEPIEDIEPDSEIESIEITDNVILAARKRGFLINSEGLRLPFKALGYNGENFYVFSYLEKQIISLTTSSMSKNNMVRLAELNAWESFFSSKRKLSTSDLVDNFSRLIIRACQERGFFIPSESIRGSGVWIDNDRVVVHYGDTVEVDGKATPIENIDSDYVYVIGKKIKRAKSKFTQKDGKDLIDICSRALWANKVSGLILAGWLTSSMACSAFDWRAHLWIMGLSGSGKSTVINKIVRRALEVNVLNADQGTTESSIRNDLRHDGKPLVYDEADRDEVSIKNIMDNVMLLARGASDGKIVGKRGQTPIKLVFSACFGGINPLLESSATSSRIIQLKLISPKTTKNSEEEYLNWLIAIEDLMNKDFSARLFKYSADNVKILLANQEVLKKALIKITRNGRAADQLSFPLAGAWLLKTTEVITYTDAVNWLVKYDWGGYTTAQEAPDSDKLIEYLSRISVPVKTRMETIDITIGELISCASGRGNRLSIKRADMALNQFSMKVSRGRFYIALESQAIAKLLREKPQWTSRTSGWGNILEHHKDAQRHSRVKFGEGSICTSAISIPVIPFITDAEYNNMAKENEEEEEIIW